MENSKIQWTDATFNAWWGCTKVSAGCKNCYAETLDNRYNHENPHWGPGSSRKGMSPSYWHKPINWNKAAEAAGVPKKVFCASMADVFEDHPEVVEHRQRLFDLIEHTPWLIWQLLTKRPENIKSMVPDWWLNVGFPNNVWIGTSVEDESVAERIEHLVQLDAVVKFLSCEPLLGDVYLPVDANDGSCMIDWVIVGGESGPRSRPMHPDWVYRIARQCEQMSVPFFFKQWGEYIPLVERTKLGTPVVDPAKYYRMDNGIDRPVQFGKLGKKETGRTIFGREWNQFPQIITPHHVIAASFI